MAIFLSLPHFATRMVLTKSQRFSPSFHDIITFKFHFSSRFSAFLQIKSHAKSRKRLCTKFTTKPILELRYDQFVNSNIWNHQLYIAATSHIHHNLSLLFNNNSITSSSILPSFYIVFHASAEFLCALSLHDHSWSPLLLIAVSCHSQNSSKMCVDKICTWTLGGFVHQTSHPQVRNNINHSCFSLF